ncbi:MAG: flagellar biosynthetic protein FliO [Gammaproteobacteria bacterium]|nr:flagellar biosynthetic protein FliO [Gammaproteobacteria bacterium]
MTSPLVPERSSIANMLNVTFGLLVVLVFIALTAWLVRRFGNFQVSAKGHLKIVGGLHMGTRERVVLIQVGDQQLLIGVAPGRIQTLHVLDQPLSIDGQSSPSTDKFSDKLLSALKGTKSI